MKAKQMKTDSAKQSNLVCV